MGIKTFFARLIRDSSGWDFLLGDKTWVRGHIFWISKITIYDRKENNETKW
jgi:hypothetical protein